ncbi:hypothetical protein [Flaviaesturariibacter amylovorans]|uniref:Uncharacterized protein n=1 Tax=Flaviaesturariibacter amylovorans TaxID=1084520 RepID=A0ABP8GN69_9BACT
MALDLYDATGKELLYSIDDAGLTALEPIFLTYQHWTGIPIDPYADGRLSQENAATLIRIIDQWALTERLEIDRPRTIEILSFRGILNYFILRKTDLLLRGD